MGKRVLVVEDNELNLKLFCDLLRVHGHVSEPVRDGREAQPRAEAFQPDLVIMDIQLPHVSGLDLIQRLKADAALRHIPIMAVTAFAAKGDEERIRAAGAEAYVSKPISVMKFIQSVNALMATVDNSDVAGGSAHSDGEPQASPRGSESRSVQPILAIGSEPADTNGEAPPT